MLEARPSREADAVLATTGPIGGRSGRGDEREVREVAVEPGGPRPLVRRGTSPLRRSSVRASGDLGGRPYARRMRILVFLLVLALGAVVVAVLRANQRRAEARRRAELEPVKKLAFEDITALGVELQDLDLELAGRELDAGAQRRLPAGPGRLRGRQDRRRPDHAARRHQAHHRDPRGRPLRDGLRARARRGPPAADPTPAVLLRPAARPLGGRRDLRAARRYAARRPGLRARRRAGPRRRRARRPQGDGRLPAGALLAGRTGLPPLRHGLLRRVRADGLDVHGPDVRRLRRHRRGHRRAGRGHRRRRRRDVRGHRRPRSTASTSSDSGPGSAAPPASSTSRAATRSRSARWATGSWGGSTASHWTDEAAAQLRDAGRAREHPPVQVLQALAVADDLHPRDVEHVARGALEVHQHLAAAARLVGRQVGEVGVPARHQVGHERQGPRLERHAEHQQVVAPVDVVARVIGPAALAHGAVDAADAAAQRLLARWLQRAHGAVGVEGVRRRVRPARRGVPLGVDPARRRGRTTPWMSRACAHRVAPQAAR